MLSARPQTHQSFWFNQPANCTQKDVNRKSFLVFLLASASAMAQYARPGVMPSERLNAGASEDENIDLIAKFKDGANTDVDHGSRFSGRHGVNPRFNRVLISSHAYILRRSEIERMAADLDVEFVAPDREVHTSVDRSRAAVMAKAAVSRLGVSGSRVTVAVIDSGLNSSSEAFSDLIPFFAHCLASPDHFYYLGPCRQRVACQYGGPRSRAHLSSLESGHCSGPLYFLNVAAVAGLPSLISPGNLSAIWDKFQFAIFPCYLAGGLISALFAESLLLTPG